MLLKIIVLVVIYYLYNYKFDRNTSLLYERVSSFVSVIMLLRKFEFLILY